MKLGFPRQNISSFNRIVRLATPHCDKATLAIRAIGPASCRNSPLRWGSLARPYAIACLD